MNNTIIHGDALTVLKSMPDNIVDCVVTSPPYYGLRNYGVEGQLGLEKTPEEYVRKMVDVFSEVRRVLKKKWNLVVEHRGFLLQQLRWRKLNLFHKERRGTQTTRETK